MMQERNTYQDVPVEIIKRFVLNKIGELDEIQLTRVYEIITGNTCISKTDEDYSKVNIIVHNKHNWN